MAIVDSTLLARSGRRLGQIARPVAESGPSRFIRALEQEIEEDDVFGMAAEMAYRFLFAIFPLMLFLVASLGILGEVLGIANLSRLFMNDTADLLPDQVSQSLSGYVTTLATRQSSAFAVVGLAGAFWGASGGIGTLIKGLNRAYHVPKSQSFFHRQVLGFLGVLTVPALGVFLFVTATLNRGAVQWIGSQLGWGPYVIGLLNALRWPVLGGLVFFGFSVLYHYLPNCRYRYWQSMPGSVIASLGWLGLTRAFGLYVDNFGHYNATYGSFGALMAFLLWLYLVGVIILIGAEVNALLALPQRELWTRR